MPEAPAPIDCPILREHAPDKLARLGTLDDHDGVLYWAAKVDGQAVLDPFEERPLRLPYDSTPLDLVEAVCPEDGLEHRIEAVLKGGKQHAPRATVKLGIHRRGAGGPPPTPAPAAAPPVLTPPGDAWTQVIQLASTAQANSLSLAALERDAHMKLLAAQQIAVAQMFERGMQSVERGLQAVAAGQIAQRQAAAAEPPPPGQADFLAQLFEYGPKALELGRGALDLLGLDGADLKGLVMGQVQGAAESSIKKALAENLGAGALMLMEAGSDLLRAKMGAGPAGAVEAAAQAAGEAAG